jgi:hypothetical protein
MSMIVRHCRWLHRRHWHGSAGAHLPHWAASLVGRDSAVSGSFTLTMISALASACAWSTAKAAAPTHSRWVITSYLIAHCAYQPTNSISIDIEFVAYKAL